MPATLRSADEDVVRELDRRVDARHVGDRLGDGAAGDEGELRQPLGRSRPA